MLMTSKGQSVRIKVGGEKGIRETGRNAQGVKLMNLNEGETIQDVAKVMIDAGMEGEEASATDETPPAPEASGAPEVTDARDTPPASEESP
jgi:DNA gyrase subunit A